MNSEEKSSLDNPINVFDDNYLIFSLALIFGSFLDTCTTIIFFFIILFMRNKPLSVFGGRKPRDLLYKTFEGQINRMVDSLHKKEDKKEDKSQ